ncbi:T9SS type A sorting domain-containing protein [Arcicella rigui]|uniref:T9SS type A sorting domain-containing protein n=1 Tax=Arcicella rigui TaxID=797020 RepID=A0ABU5Q7Q9_9BACT|nr:T9SS type A sorting domain-containing protein [Arcicella rigui]MEA5138880.1 T9SS type A sorting domain-containing protein [Arcicella rigui]
MRKILLTTFLLIGSFLGFSQRLKQGSTKGNQIVDYSPTPEQAKERVLPMGYTQMIEAQLAAARKLSGNTRQASTNANKAKFEVTFENANGVSAEVKQIFENAAAIWADALNSDVPIRIYVQWKSLATGVLGSAGASTYYHDFQGAAKAGTWYPVALAEKMARQELNGASEYDIYASFNSDRNDWNYGATAPTKNQYDLLSVVLHEFGHGLGFIGTFAANETIAGWGDGSYAGYAGIFDNYIENNAGLSLIDTSQIENFSTALRSYITSNRLFLNSPSVVRAKLYAPSTYSSGSSIYHVDQATYPVGNPNALMTPTIAAGEVTREIGPIVLNFFNDIGWASSSIIHTPLKDNEDTNKDYVLTATVYSDAGIKDGTVKLFVSTTNILGATEVPLTKVGNQYSYTLPKSTNRRLIQYYWAGEDLAGNKIASPAEAPRSTKGFYNYYNFTIGADTVKPVLSYQNNIYNIFNTDTKVTIPTGYTYDNIGIDSVYIEYLINGVKQAPIMLTTVTQNSIVAFDGSFNFSAGKIKKGDIITYRIVVKDKAKIKNVRYSPESGYYEIKVIQLLSAVKTYSNNFDAVTSPPEDFYLKGFSFTQPSGFNNISLNSDHPYKNGSEETFPEDGNLFSNYIAQLLRPVTLKSDSAKIYFNEIVLVEPGADGATFPDREFFDYVVVEGSKDNGKTWQWFQDGWDSNADPTWLNAWQGNNIDKDQNSKVVGSTSLYRKREIDMLKSGDFKAGDNVLIRFRLLADPLAYGWGWSIDDLNIQVAPKVTVLANEPIATIDVNISPNPSSGEFLLKASFQKNTKEININVHDMIGRAVLSEHHLNSGTEFSSSINLSHLQSGAYILKLQTENGVLFKKIILTK